MYAYKKISIAHETRWLGNIMSTKIACEGTPKDRDQIYLDSNESFSQELEIGKGRAGQQPTKSTLLIHQVQKVNKNEAKPE